MDPKCFLLRLCQGRLGNWVEKKECTFILDATSPTRTPPVHQPPSQPKIQWAACSNVISKKTKTNHQNVIYPRLKPLRSHNHSSNKCYAALGEKKGMCFPSICNCNIFTTKIVDNYIFNYHQKQIYSQNNEKLQYNQENLHPL